MMKSPSQEQHRQGIAIVGIAGRFPGASTIDDFWRNLAAGVESVHFASGDELATAGVPAELTSNPDFVPASSTVHEPDFFDASFFGFSAREAEIIDPQHRVFLECAWESLEDAACDPSTFPGAIGVFAGAGMNTYGVVNLFSNPEIIRSVGAYQAMLGNDKDFLCSRVSYKLNLRGPSIGVQAACSTSLVAVQMAFESLLRRECDMALAGGVSIALPQPAGYLYVPGMILSPDGHCRAFDAKAAGTVPGAGAGVVVLRRLEDALESGDHIYAVIRGAAINNDGAAKVGYTAPSIDGQSAAIRKSMEMAGFDPASIAYVEAHGTGTEVGDPIEVTALARAFESAPKASRSCALGALKTNIGHLDAAAGVAGLIKAALSVHHRTIPPTLHFTEPNPLIDFANTPFYVNDSDVLYDREQPFRAGVSSFGIGGTNVHVSLEEAPIVEKSPEVGLGSQLIALSARSAAALDRQSERLLACLEDHPEANLADIAFTLQCGRRAFGHRKFLVARDVAQLKESLRSGQSSPAVQRPFRADPVPVDPAGVVFLFPGQGSQYVNMGLGLYRTAPAFRETVDRCAEILRPLLGCDVREILYPDAGKEAEAEQRLSQTAITQPALFVIEYAMATLWMSCGIHPAAMLGHSVGEYVAACLAGVFSLEDALALMVARGALIQSAPSGSMLAVRLSEQDLEPLLTPELSIAAINAPTQTVASGPTPAIDALEATLQAKKIDCRRLRTSHAFHSKMMDVVAKQFVERVAATSLYPPKLRYLSNVTGRWITKEQATDPEYWGLHHRNAVRFADGVECLFREADYALLGLGPGDTLLSLVRMQTEGRSSRVLIPSMRHRLSKDDDCEVWLNAVGRLWLLNERIDWSGVHRGERRRRLSLPTYPFERQRYWIEPKQGKARPEPTALEKRPSVADWFYVPSWKRSAPELLQQRKIGASDTWLILAEDGELSDAIADGLTGYGRLVRVRTGKEFRRVSSELYQVDPANPEDFTRLIDGLAASGHWPDRIVHAWMPGTGQGEGANRLLERGVLSAVSLIQAAASADASRPIEFNAVGDRAYSVYGEQIASPASRSLNVLLGVAALEDSRIISRQIDVDLSAGARAVARQVVDELLSVPAGETIAYRGRARWIEQFEPVHLESPGDASTAGRSSISLRDSGTYLITGGLGGVGMVFANHLAKSAHARVILTSRTPLPADSEWERLLQSPDTPPLLKRRIEGVQSIEKVGGGVSILAGDVADPDAMRRVVSQVRAQYGPIHGIIHAAGTSEMGLLQTNSRAQAIGVFSPKVQGVEWIREALGSPELDFVLLCSSISAVAPSFGLSDYGAANAYLDGFAARYDDPSATRVISVNFDTWQEVGMVADAEVPGALAHRHEDQLKHGIRSSEASEVFDRLLEWPMPQMVVSTRDLNRLRSQIADAVQKTRVLPQPSEPGEMLEPVEVQDAGAGPSGAEDAVEQFILDSWQDLLGVKPIGAHDNFFELGGHSLLGIQVLARIRERYKVELALRMIFEAATPAELAEHVRLALWVSTPERVSSVDAEREEIEI